MEFVLLLKCVVTLSVLLSSGQCIHRVMRLVVCGEYMVYDIMVYAIALRVEILPLFSFSEMCSLRTKVERL